MEVAPSPASGGGSLRVNEIFLSVQGESSFAGLPCVFIRLAGCHLRCSFCDTAYAFSEGEHRSLEAVRERVRELAGRFAQPAGGQRMPLVELTGGEPLLQGNSLPLMRGLCDEGFYRAAGNERGAGYRARGPAGASHHGSEMPRQR